MTHGDDPKSDNEPPKIFRIAEIKGPGHTTRRKFIKNSLKTAAGAGLLAATGCADSEFDVLKNTQGECSCHVVCTCDAESEDNNEGSEYGAQFTGTVCTCDLVCTCNTVCTCNSDSSDSGGGSYYYTYWYPN
ncbi:MAG: twin-arginine translocation signal domain-containing protein [Proteobacteria bacterium]|nr:twin-arginine translocation signal domain-containing protein [Pseudomonadota bacterium]